VNLTGGTPFSLNADTDYWLCLGANATGATSGFTSPNQPQGMAALYAGAQPIRGRSVGIPEYGQFSTTAGAMPSTLPSVSAPSSWTASVPIFFLVGTAS
jgi:hypothetical protein